MNILEINTVDQGGGAAKVAWQIKTELEKSGWVVSLFVKHKYSDDPRVHIARWPNILFRIFKKMSGKDAGAFLANKLRPLLSNDIAFFGTDKILLTKELLNADLVHCHNLHGNYFTLSTLKKMSVQKPIIWTLHDMWAITAHCAHTDATTSTEGLFPCGALSDYQGLTWDNTKYLARTKKKIYKDTAMDIVVPCLWLKEKIMKSVLGDKRVTVIYNGVDTEIFKPLDKTEARKKMRLPLDKKIVLFIASGGMENTDKGGNVAKELVKRYEKETETVFAVVGGAKEVTTRNIIERRYENDEYAMATYYSAADILLFPSEAETFPLTVIEAMACGTVPVSFDVGGVKEVIAHEKNGFIATNPTVGALAQGIDWVFGLSEQERGLISKNATATVRGNFTLALMFKKYLELYTEVIMRAKKKPADNLSQRM